MASEKLTAFDSKSRPAAATPPVPKNIQSPAATPALPLSVDDHFSDAALVMEFPENVSANAPGTERLNGKLFLLPTVLTLKSSSGPNTKEPICQRYPTCNP